MYAFGGDALAIYYDLSYHVCHGKGHWFTGMNYPHGELIYLTDAQGALAMILQWINQNVIGVCDYTIGIIHSFNVISVLAAVLTTYFLLRRIGCIHVVSSFFSPLVILLSPQIFRLVGHFGLAYPMVIPLAILWFLRKEDNQRWEKRDILFFFIMLFFSFNNPYVGAASASLLLIAFMLDVILRGRLKTNFLFLLVSVSIVLIPYIYFKTNDPILDRIKLQWGYFSFNTEFQGIVAPVNSFLHKLIYAFNGDLKIINDESNLNIGIIALFTIIIFLVARLFNNSFLKNLVIHRSFLLIIWSTLLLFLYTSGLLFSIFKQDFIEENLGFLLMFKALARLSWSLYFSLTILSVVIINHIIKEKSNSFKALVLSWTIFIWVAEIFSYFGPRFSDTNHANFLSRNKKTELLIEMKNVPFTDFQAILCIPKLVAWSDNLLSEHHFITQFMSQRISHATGIPLISAMLSRIGTGQALESIELLANQLIEKSLVSKFPNSKDILLVARTDFDGLTSGEKSLIAIADTLYVKENYMLMRLPIKKINQFETEKNRLLSEKKIQLDTSKNTFYYQNFENESSDMLSYFGLSSKKIEKGEHPLISHTIANPLDSHYVFSVWTHVDSEKYGIGWVKCKVKDKNGDIKYEQYPDTRKSNDVHDQWIRTEIRIPVKKDYKIEISMETNRTIYIDELLLRPEKMIHVIDVGKKDLLINGYKVRK
jgi:hypothetical protein